MKKNHEQLLQKLLKKEELLDKIAKSGDPIISSQIPAHKRRVENAENFLHELQEVKEFVVNTDSIARLVPKPTFDKYIAKADFAMVELDGEFCKIVSIENCPYEKMFLIHTASMDAV